MMNHTEGRGCRPPGVCMPPASAAEASRGTSTARNISVLTSTAWRQTSRKRIFSAARAFQRPPDMVFMQVDRLLTGTGRHPSFSSWDTARMNSASVLQQTGAATARNFESGAAES